MPAITIKMKRLPAVPLMIPMFLPSLLGAEKVQLLCISRHFVRPKKPARHTVSIFTGRKKTSVSHLCISVTPYPIGTKFASELPASQGSLHSKLEGTRSSHFRDTSCQSFDFFSFVFFFVFSHTCKNCYKTQTRTPIALKFGTQKGSPKANPSIKFGANPMNGSGVMI